MIREEIWMQSYMITTLFNHDGFASINSLHLICLLHIKTDVDDYDNLIFVMMMTKKIA